MKQNRSRGLACAADSARAVYVVVACGLDDLTDLEYCLALGADSFAGAAVLGAGSILRAGEGCIVAGSGNFGFSDITTAFYRAGFFGVARIGAMPP